LPLQLGLMVDGGDLSPITCIQTAEDGLFLHHLTTTFPFVLRPEARVLVIEPRAGLDLLTALQNGASSVVALESNPLVIEAVREQEGRCAASVYDHPRVTLVFEEARSYLRRSSERFDVLLLSLTGTYQPVISGAYGLLESYTYTTEAFQEYLRHLSEDGIFVTTRWMQASPSEELRACALLAQALERAGVGDPSQRVLAFRSWSTATLLAKRAPFSADEIAELKDFCAQHSFDLIYYPGMVADEANRYNILSDTAHHDSFRRVLSGSEREGFLRDYVYEVSPPSDDRPFFFHYFKWVQVPHILRSLGKIWLPFGGSGFLILVVLLVLAAALSVLLILLPLILRRDRDFRSLTDFGSLRSTLLYFTCLGFGFLFVEMPLLQQFILFLGQPAYSFALVLFSVLFFSGLGSLLSRRLPLRPLLLALSVVVLVYPLFLPRLFALAIHWPLPLRLAVSVLGLAPLGFLLGLPMPGGIRLLEQRAPQLIPWAWAVNGCASVVSSILAVIGAVTFGFSSVLVAGAMAYLLAWFTLPTLVRANKAVAG
jgi:spermidine synthase